MDIFEMVRAGQKAQLEQETRETELKQEFDAMKVKKLSPFDWLNSIYNKDHIMTPENEKQYSAFMVNRGLSQNVDTVVHAFYMDQMSKLPLDMQYDYLFHAVRKGRRRGGWAKAPKHDVDTIMEVFQVNQNQALAISARLTDEQHEQLNNWFNDRGGVTRKRRTK
ncbi:clamp loader of DNA polymerase [Vibrio phage D479]